MLTRTIFAVVLFAVLKCCHAQPLPVISVATPSASSPDAVLPSGIALRWKSADLATNRVSIWTDRIQGYNWVQSTVNNQPTNDGLGVQFYTTNNLVSTNVTSASTWAFLLVFNFRSVASQQMVLGDSTGGGHIFVGMSSAGSLYNTILGGAGVTPIAAIQYDLIGAHLGVNSYGMYTNGISAWTGTAAWNDTTIISKVGNAAAGTWQLNGGIQEFIVWTNAPTWSSVTISNVHYYATNTYPHTP